MLHLAKHPTLISFEPAFREAGGFETAVLLLSTRTCQTCTFRSWACCWARASAWSRTHRPRTPSRFRLHATSAEARPLAHWLPEALSVLSLLIREGLHRCVEPRSGNSRHPGRARGGEPDGPASQEEPSTSSFAVVRQQLQLCMAVFRVIEQHPDNFVLTLLQRIDVLQRLGSAIGVVWLYTRNVADDKVGQGQGRTTPGTIDTSIACASCRSCCCKWCGAPSAPLQPR